MQINNNAQANSIYQMQNRLSNASNNSAAPIQSKTINDTVSISSAGLNAKDNWQRVANDYDVTNISQNEIVGMTSELMDNGLISSRDGLHLMAPRSVDNDPEVKYDLLASMRESLAFAKENGGSAEELKIIERSVDILESLQDLSRKT